MTVVDSSAVLDFLLGLEAAGEVEALLEADGAAAAPDLLVLEVLAVLRRDMLAGDLGAERADGAVADLGDLAIDLFPTLHLRDRAWELRDNMTAADGLFVALAEHLDEPLATKDARLARAAGAHSGVTVVEVG